MRPLREVINSRSLIIIGASRNPAKPGAQLIQTLRASAFKGPLAGVNPQGGELDGVKFYRSVGDVPFEVDLAVLIIPPESVPAAVAECAQKGVKGVVISSEGFAEAGAAGREYQDQVKEILLRTGMRGFGPNTLGIVNTETGLTTSYIAQPDMLKPGSIGFAAQSGIFVGAFLRYVSSIEGLGLSKGVGLGNKVDVDECDALDFFLEDQQTRLVGLYLEDIRDGSRFMASAKKITPHKPVLVVKSGRTQAGSRAISSHTASLAVDDKVVEAAFRQSGILRVKTIEELLAALMGLNWMPLPSGNKLAVVTYSGAQGIMSVDMAAELGLGVAVFSDQTRRRLSQVISTDSKARNPIDTWPDTMVHGFEKIGTEILGALLDDPGVHGIVFISFAVTGPEAYKPLADVVTGNRTKPVFFSLLGEKNLVTASTDYLLGERIPCYLFPETAIKVFDLMVRQAQWVGSNSK